MICSTCGIDSPEGGLAPAIALSTSVGAAAFAREAEALVATSA